MTDVVKAVFDALGVWWTIAIAAACCATLWLDRERKIRNKIILEEQIRVKIRDENAAIKEKERLTAVALEELKASFRPVRDPYDILKHEIFINLEEYINSRIFALVINERLRSAIYIDFLGIKFGAVHQELYEFFERGDINRLPKEEFRYKFLEVIVSIIVLYEGRARMTGIPHVAIALFNHWHHNTVTHITCEIKRLTSPLRNKLNSEVAMEILDVINESLEATLGECQSALRELNGQLDMVEYKGIISDNISRREVRGLSDD